METGDRIANRAEDRLPVWIMLIILRMFASASSEDSRFHWCKWMKPLGSDRDVPRGLGGPCVPWPNAPDIEFLFYRKFGLANETALILYPTSRVQIA